MLSRGNWAWPLIVAITAGIGSTWVGCYRSAPSQPLGQASSKQSSQASGQPSSQPSSKPASSEAAADRPPLFDGLGTHTRRVTTSSAEAQSYFDQGLNFLYAFNHDEAIRSFTYATELDPRCAMAWWGISLANGPHINNPLLPEDRATKAWKAWQQADRLASEASEVERALIAALGRRYSAEPVEDRVPLDNAYADAMREVWKTYPQDADIGALTAEALMDLRPWDLWTSEGVAQPGTDEIVNILENVLSFAPNHPLALHLYIHAVEASPTPGLADDEADRLRLLQPGLGHMTHMPSHIDVRRGRWAEAAAANRRAIEADQAYRARAPQADFYQVYMAHNHHMLAYSLIMMGQSQGAIDTINEMVAEIPADWIKANALLADGFTAMPLEMLVRFGKWDQVLAAPEPPDYLPLARSMRHHARAIAFAAKGDVEQANAERELFQTARELIPEKAQFGNNLARDLAAVAERMMTGEILFRQGETEAGLAALREAVALEDKLRYSEPPDWIHPIRHALGAALLKAGKYEEAEQVYRADLERVPNNGWSLFGLAQSLQLQNRADEANEVRQQFQQIWSDADIQITSSCLCQP